MQPRITVTLVAALTALTVSWSGVVRAGNDDSFPVGNRAAMAGGAVAATVSDGSAAYYNPAGLGSVERSSVDVSASGYTLRFYEVPRFLRAPGAEKHASVTEFVAVPTQIAYVRRLASSVSLGLGYYVPRAGDVVLRERLRDVSDDDESTWSLDLRLSSATYVLAAAIGVQLPRGLRIGGGLFGVYEKEVRSTGLFGTRTLDDMPSRAVQFGLLGTFGRYAGELRVGLQWDALPNLTFAISAQGPRLQLVRTGEETVNLSATDLMADEDMRLVTSSETGNPGEQLGLLGLGRYVAAVSYSYVTGSVSAEFDVQPAYEHDGTRTARRFTWNARVGVTHDFSETFAFGVGVFTDRGTNADTGADDGASRADFYGISTGIELKDVLGLVDTRRADSLILSTIFAARYAYGTGFESGLRLRTNSERLIENVRSDIRVHEFNLHVGSALYF